MEDRASAKDVVLIPGTIGPLSPIAADAFAAKGYDPIMLGDFSAETINRGLGNIDNDVCISAVAAIGQYLEFFDKHGTQGVLVAAPYTCQGCRAVNLPNLARVAFDNAGISDVDVVALEVEELRDMLRVFDGDESAEDAVTRAENMPGATDLAIGVCGPVPVICAAEFRRTVVQKIIDAGCHAVLPPLELLLGERDAFSPAMAYFAEQGISTVVGISPFGCLSSHAFGRGGLRRLRELYPHIDFTILDYDPSASDINVVNRMELVIQSARERHQKAG